MTERKINVNTASIEDFKSISGIGQARAEAIVAARKNLGGFKSLEDLAQVPKIGSSLVEKYRSLFFCRHSALKTRNNFSTPTTRSLRSTTISRWTRKRKHTPDDACKIDLRLIRSPEPVRQHKKKPMVDFLNSGGRRLRSQANQSRESLGQSSDEAEKTPNDIKLDLFPAFAEGSRRSKRIAGNNSIAPGEACPVPASGTALREHPQNNPAEAAKSLMDANSAGNVERQKSEDSLPSTSIRSKIPVSMENVQRHWKKQKLECSSIKEELEQINDRGTSANEVHLIGDDSNCEPSDSSPVAHQISKKSRIPSRKNPQPELHGWLGIFQEWGHAEKLLALDELMALCDPTQVRHVMQVIEPQFQRDFISLLPKELALYVLSFLEPRDLLRAAQTCTYWHSLAEDNLLWREKCQEEGVSESLVYPGGRRGRNGLSGGLRGDKSTWKSLYLRQKQIEHNWRTAARMPKVLKGHDDHVITCLEFSGNKIVSGSDDNTLKVWSAVTGRCLRTLTGHTGGVWSSQMSGSVIVSGSTDRTLKVWNADTGQCKHTLYGHTSTVRCMHLHNRRVVSGSRDATLRVWDIDSGQCLHILIGHVAAVRCVQYDGHRVISGGYDYMVKIWDPESETCLQTLAGHTNRVYSLQFDGAHIVSGSLDTSIRVWNVETGVCVHTLIGHQSLTSGMELKDNILVSGNADSTVKVWNITTGQCLQTLQGPNKHQSAVTCLQFNGTLIITSSDDGTVKLWDLKTGEFLRNLVALASGGSGGVVWRIRCSNTKLVCAVGSRNGTEETKLLVIDFDVQDGENSTAGSGGGGVVVSSD